MKNLLIWWLLIWVDNKFFRLDNHRNILDGNVCGFDMFLQIGSKLVCKDDSLLCIHAPSKNKNNLLQSQNSHFTVIQGVNNGIRAHDTILARTSRQIEIPNKHNLVYW